MSNHDDKSSEAKKTPFWERLKVPAMEVVFLAASLFGGGNTKASEKADEKDSEEKNTSAVINKDNDKDYTRISSKYLNKDFTASGLVEITGTSDLSNYYFSKKELEEMKAGPLGAILAKAAKKAAYKYNNETQCYKAVKEALRKSKVADLTGFSACEAIEQMDKCANFIKIKCDPQVMDKLPDGTVIVYDRGETTHGHIDVVINGRAASSKMRNVNKGAYRWVTKANGKKVKQSYGEINIYLPKDTKLSQQSFEMCSQANLNREHINIWSNLSQMKEASPNPQILESLRRVQQKLSKTLHISTLSEMKKETTPAPALTAAKLKRIQNR